MLGVENQQAGSPNNNHSFSLICDLSMT